MEDYTDDVEIAAILGGDEAAEVAAQQRQKRQAAWVEKGESTDAKDWRPAKRPRVASFAFLRLLDNQACLLAHGGSPGQRCCRPCVVIGKGASVCR